MPRTIKVPHFPNAYEGVYIPHKQLQLSRRSQTILDETQHWANQQAKKALQNAEQLRLQALREGYRDGVLAAAQALTKRFDETYQLASKLYKELEHRAHELLSSALNNPDIVLTLLDEWLKHHQEPNNNTLVKLLIPLNSQLSRAQITEHIEPLWRPSLIIEYHQNERFVIQYGDEVAEFDPAHFIKKAKDQLLQNFQNISERYSQLDESALKNIQHCFEQRFGKSADLAQPTKAVEKTITDSDAVNENAEDKQASLDGE